MPTLHILSASPNDGAALRDCLAAARSGSVILLIENGVYACQQPDALRALRDAQQNGIRLCALGPDLQARGLTLKPTEPIEIVDYAGFVGLVTKTDRSVTWA